MKKLKLFHVSLVLGILSFVQFLGIEKAVMAIVVGLYALRQESEESGVKKFAWPGIILGILYSAVIAGILIFEFPKLISVIEKLK